LVGFDQAFAVYTPSPTMYLFGTGNSWPNGNIAFSYSPSLSWSAPAIPSSVDASYVFHGNVWIDSVGWTTFDHSVAGSEVKINDSTCITNLAQSTCTLTWFLWSKNIGWIRFSGNAGVPDVEFHRPTLTLSWMAWSNQVGWIEISGIKSILGPIIPVFSGGTDLWWWDFALSTTGAMDLPLAIPPSINSLLWALSPITMDICILGGGFCALYTYDAATRIFSPRVDLSLATDYTYTITDPFGSTTTWLLHVYAGPVISNGAAVMPGTYNWNGLFKEFCLANVWDSKCPDIAPSTSFVTWELKTGDIVWPKYANNQDGYIANIRLRDAYGNPIQSVAWVKDVSMTLQLTSTLDYISTPNLYQYGWMLAPGWLWDAFSLDYFWASIPVTPAGPFMYTRPYLTSGESIKIRSFAPTTSGNANMPVSNDITIAWVNVSVTNTSPYNFVGEGWYSILSLLKSTPLPFRPLAEVTNIAWFSDIQMWRISVFTGTINVNDSLNTIDLWSSFVIHWLTIGDGVSTTTSTFQDFVSTGDECNAFTSASWSSSPGYIGYCSRLPNSLATWSSIITMPFASTREHVFEAMPRRIVEIELAQGYKYDSIIRYTVEGKEIIYPSLISESLSTNDKVFGNAVKIIGQKSGNNIFQSFVNSEQTSISPQSRSESINLIRKNIGLLTRNVTFTTDTYTWSNLKVYKKDIVLNPQQELITDGKRTIVAYGDITLNSDLTNPNDANTLAIIALKNEWGTGWNIYIGSNIKRLDASIIAQGSLFSGDKSWAPRYYAQEPNAIDTLKNQLYIYGAVSSLNTIWGASLESGSRCPSTDIACDNENALIYDFEHLRYYRWWAPEAAPLARGSANLVGDDKNSSLIIEFNEKVISNAPPWLSKEQ
jgi:hypothetical protein